jgi:hypothetical protein
MKKYTVIYLRDDRLTNPLYFANNGQLYISETLTMVEGLIHPEQIVRKRFEKWYEEGKR